MRELKVGDRFVVTRYTNGSHKTDNFAGKKLIVEDVIHDKDANTFCYRSLGWKWENDLIDWVATEKLYSDNDTVNSPSHYCTGAVETIESIKNIVTGNPSVFQGYCIGNTIKYISRYHKKGGAEDIKKAIKYLEFVLKDIEDETK